MASIPPLKVSLFLPRPIREVLRVIFLQNLKKKFSSKTASKIKNYFLTVFYDFKKKKIFF
jgi:hypothetical protein